MDLRIVLEQIKDKGYYYGYIGLSEDAFINYMTDQDVLHLYKRDRDETFFKIVQDINSPSLTSIARSSNDFTPHTECVDEEILPDYLFLYCTENPKDTEMNTYLIDTSLFLNQCTDKEFDILSKILFVFVNKKGEEITLPLIRSDSNLEYMALTCRGYFKPNYKMLAHAQEMEIIEYMPVINKLVNYIIDHKNYVANVSLKKGELLAINNRRMLHGRENLKHKQDFNRRLVRLLCKVI